MKSLFNKINFQENLFIVIYSFEKEKIYKVSHEDINNKSNLFIQTHLLFSKILN